MRNRRLFQVLPAAVRRLIWAYWVLIVLSMTASAATICLEIAIHKSGGYTILGPLSWAVLFGLAAFGCGLTLMRRFRNSSADRTHAFCFAALLLFTIYIVGVFLPVI